MPIFSEDLRGDREPSPPQPPKKPALLVPPPPPETNVLTRKLSEESIRTELCEGPVFDSPEDQKLMPTGELDSTFKFPFPGTSDRVELIERLKRGESPAWLPNRNVRLGLHSCNLTMFTNLN